uniref:Acyltransferase n=1 Tax=Alexandrium monilatum TaxID=311494 RepID=A0A7S4PXC7_9DINO
MAGSVCSGSGPLVLSCVVMGVWLRQKMLGRGMYSLDTWGPRWLAVATAQAMNMAARFAGVTFEDDTREKWHKDPLQRLDPNRQYLTPWHPHGALTFCAAFFTNTMVSQSTTPRAPGPTGWFVGIADLLFRFPLLGEGLVLWNCRPVSEATSRQVLKSGFCRLAIQHGTPLVPIYAFGESQVFSTYEWGRRATERLHGKFGIAVPMIVPWPNKVMLHMKWGRPVEVGPREESPTDERVQRLFAEYVKELARLFEEHRHTCLPADVAKRGLTVLWRGHSKEELDGLLDTAGLERDRVPCLVTATGQRAPPGLPHSRL